MKYPIMEQFLTLQGEGVHAGKSAYFVRLGGCDVGCVWCDVKESWEADAHPQIELEDLLSQIASTPANIIVITGGEPTMYDLNPLCEGIKYLGKKVHIETAATNIIQGDFDWVCVSPKKFKPSLESELAKANELKVIVFNKTDLEWAQKFKDKAPENCAFLLQPEWSKKDTMTPLIIDFVMHNPEWALSMQTHKYLEIP